MANLLSAGCATNVFLPKQLKLSSKLSFVNPSQRLPQLRHNFTVKPLFSVSANAGLSNAQELTSQNGITMKTKETRTKKDTKKLEVDSPGVEDKDGKDSDDEEFSLSESDIIYSSVREPKNPAEQESLEPKKSKYAIVVARSKDYNCEEPKTLPKEQIEQLVESNPFLKSAIEILLKKVGVTEGDIEIVPVMVGFSDCTVQKLKKLGRYANVLAVGTLDEREEIKRGNFPQDFLFGVATSAYQVEGASKEGGKGESIWDVYARTPGNTHENATGDIAVDQYHRYEDDVKLMADLGFKAYRFSIAWTRIFPDGCGNKPNEEGIQYYNNLIDELIKYGMEPVVTLYHWDLPQNLETKYKGFLGRELVDFFATYARTCFLKFGDKVKHWITFNEPIRTATKGYGSGDHAPGKNDSRFTDPYVAAHNLILAHAKAASIYKNEFQARQGGFIGIAPDCEYAKAASSDPKDKEAADRHNEFQLGWFLNPLFNQEYPKTMRERFGDRLPKFSPEDIEMLKDSIDFVGINQYTTRYVAHEGESNEPNFYSKETQIKRHIESPDHGVIGEQVGPEWLYDVPWGLRGCLNYIKEKFGDEIPIMITENGMGDDDRPEYNLDDQRRVEYYMGHLAAVDKAINVDKVNVIGYFAWSFMDNFEWSRGYSKRFGLVHVDYKNDLKRTPKSSGKWFKKFLTGSEI